MEKKKNVVIVGGGFAGINAAKQLKDADANVLIIDRTNHHLFQPLLYQVASAALAPANIAMPIREILRKQQNTYVIMGEVTKVDTEKKKVTLAHVGFYPFDCLIVAPGTRHSYFGHSEWEKHAPGLKSLNDAIQIRENVLLAFEKAERCGSMETIEKMLRFVIIGGGPTGVEMAGAVAEIAQKTLFDNFRKIKPEHSQIYLIEAGTRVLSAYPEELSEKAKSDLQKMGVKVLTNTKVTGITEDGVALGDTFIPTANVIWAAGNQAPEFLKTLNVPLDRAGRVIVGPDLTIPGHSDIFVIGDAAAAFDANKNPLPGIAPVAIQQGRYVAHIIAENIEQKNRKPFVYVDKGTMATIGRAKAVAVIGKHKLHGFLAWLAWGFIHIFYLISFPNRLLVMVQWMNLYFTNKRQSRIIKKPMFEDEDTDPCP